MNQKVSFDYSKVSSFVNAKEVDMMKKLTGDAKELLVSKTGEGSDFLGWIDLPVNYDKEEFDRIKKAAKKIQQDSEVLLVIGIGGSYLGARAAIEFLRHSFYNVLHHLMQILVVPSVFITTKPDDIFPLYFSSSPLEDTQPSFVQIKVILSDRPFSTILA